jgi:hypothetical protein
VHSCLTLTAESSRPGGGSRASTRRCTRSPDRPGLDGHANRAGHSVVRDSAGTGRAAGRVGWRRRGAGRREPRRRVRGRVRYLDTAPSPRSILRRRSRDIPITEPPAPETQVAVRRWSGQRGASLQAAAGGPPGEDEPDQAGCRGRGDGYDSRLRDASRLATARRTRRRLAVAAPAGPGRHGWPHRHWRGPGQPRRVPPASPWIVLTGLACAVAAYLVALPRQPRAPR